MARYFKHRDTRIPSLFVPLPVDYMRQQVEGMQKKKDIIDYEIEAEDSQMAISAIPGMEIDIARRDEYNQKLLDNTEEATNIMMSMDKVNPSRSINEAARFLMQNKKLKREVVTPGTDAHTIHQNRLKFDKEWEDIDKSDYMPEEKEGRKQELLYKYRESGQYKDKGRYNIFGDFTTPGKSEWNKELRSAMSETGYNIDKVTGYTKQYKTYWQDRKTTNKQRTFSHLISSGSGLLKSNKRWQGRMKSEVEAQAWYDRRNMTGDEFQNKLRREEEAIESGGVTAESYRNTLERNKGRSVNEIPPSEFMDYKTVAGKAILANAQTLQRKEYGYTSKDKTSPFWNYEAGEPHTAGSFYNVSPTGMVTTKLKGEDVNKIVESQYNEAANIAVEYNKRNKADSSFKDSPEGVNMYNSAAGLLRSRQRYQILLENKLKGQGHGIDAIMDNVKQAGSSDIPDRYKKMPDWVKGSVEPLLTDDNYIREMLLKDPERLLSDVKFLKGNLEREGYPNWRLDVLVSEIQDRKDNIEDIEINPTKGMIRISGAKKTFLSKHMELDEDHLAASDLIDVVTREPVSFVKGKDNYFLVNEPITGELMYEVVKYDKEGKKEKSHFVERPAHFVGRDKTIIHNMATDLEKSGDTYDQEEYKDIEKFVQNMYVSTEFEDQFREINPFNLTRGQKFSFYLDNSKVDYEAQGNGYYKQVLKNGSLGKYIEGDGGLKQSLFKNFYTR